MGINSLGLSFYSDASAGWDAQPSSGLGLCTMKCGPDEPRSTAMMTLANFFRYQIFDTFYSVHFVFGDAHVVLFRFGYFEMIGLLFLFTPLVLTNLPR